MPAFVNAGKNAAVPLLPGKRAPGLHGRVWHTVRLIGRHNHQRGRNRHNVLHPGKPVEPGLVDHGRAGIKCFFHALLHPFKHWHILNGCVRCDSLTTLKYFTRGGELPLPGGEIDLPAELVEPENGGHQIFRAKHILVLDAPAFPVLRELIEHGPQQRGAVLVGLLV